MENLKFVAVNKEIFTIFHTIISITQKKPFVTGFFRFKVKIFYGGNIFVKWAKKLPCMETR